jgi:hypothetical protein
MGLIDTPSINPKNSNADLDNDFAGLKILQNHYPNLLQTQIQVHKFYKLCLF